MFLNGFAQRDSLTTLNLHGPLRGKLPDVFQAIVAKQRRRNFLRVTGHRLMDFLQRFYQ